MTEHNIEDINKSQYKMVNDEDIISFVEDFLNLLRYEKNPTNEEIQKCYVKIKNIYKI